MTLKIQCQHCGHICEAEVEGKTVICPACQKETEVREVPPLPNPKIETNGSPPPIGTFLKLHSFLLPMGTAKIRETADNFAIGSLLLIAFSLTGLLITFLIALGSNDEADATHAWIVGGSISGSLFTAGAWGYLVAQIIHIRANTDKN